MQSIYLNKTQIITLLLPIFILFDIINQFVHFDMEVRKSQKEERIQGPLPIKFTYAFQLELLTLKKKYNNKNVSANKTFHIVWQVGSKTASSKNIKEKLSIKQEIQLYDTKKKHLFAPKNSSICLIISEFSGNQTLYDSFTLNICEILNPQEPRKNSIKQIELQSKNLFVCIKLKNIFLEQKVPSSLKSTNKIYKQMQNIEKHMISDSVLLSSFHSYEDNKSNINNINPKIQNKQTEKADAFTKNNQNIIFMPKVNFHDISYVNSMSSSIYDLNGIKNQQNPEESKQIKLQYYKDKNQELKQKIQSLQLQLVQFNRMKEQNQKLIQQRDLWSKNYQKGKNEKNEKINTKRLQQLQKKNISLQRQLQDLEKQNQILLKRNQVILSELVQFKQKYHKDQQSKRSFSPATNHSVGAKVTELQNQLRKKDTKIKKLQKELQQIENQNLKMNIELMKYKNDWKQQQQVDLNQHQLLKDTINQKPTKSSNFSSFNGYGKSHSIRTKF